MKEKHKPIVLFNPLDWISNLLSRKDTKLKSKSKAKRLKRRVYGKNWEKYRKNKREMQILSRKINRGQK